MYMPMKSEGAINPAYKELRNEPPPLGYWDMIHKGFEVIIQVYPVRANFDSLNELDFPAPSDLMGIFIPS